MLRLQERGKRKGLRLEAEGRSSYLGGGLGRSGRCLSLEGTGHIITCSTHRMTLGHCLWFHFTSVHQEYSVLFYILFLFSLFIFFLTYKTDMGGRMSFFNDLWHLCMIYCLKGRLIKTS